MNFSQSAWIDGRCTDDGRWYFDGIAWIHVNRDRISRSIILSVMVLYVYTCTKNKNDETYTHTHERKGMERNHV